MNEEKENVNQTKRKWTIIKQEKYNKDLSVEKQKANFTGFATGLLAIGTFINLAVIAHSPFEETTIASLLAGIVSVGYGTKYFKQLLSSLMNITNLNSKISDLEFDLKMLDEEESRGSK